MLDWLLINITIFKFVLANDEPRGAWKTLLDSGFGGGSAHSSGLRAGPGFGGDSGFEFWGGLLGKVRNYFGLNPDDDC